MSGSGMGWLWRRRRMPGGWCGGRGGSRGKKKWNRPAGCSHAGRPRLIASRHLIPRFENTKYPIGYLSRLALYVPVLAVPERLKAGGTFT